MVLKNGTKTAGETAGAYQVYLVLSRRRQHQASASHLAHKHMPCASHSMTEDVDHFHKIPLLGSLSA